MKLILLFLIFPFITPGTTLQLKKNKKAINILITEVPLNIDSFDKNLKSGISNNFIATLTLFSQQKEISASEIKIRVIYDLWDEIFNFKITNLEEQKMIKLKTLAEVKENLSSFSFSFNSASDSSYKNITAKFELIQDPFTKEKQKKIKTWMAENRVGIPNSVISQKNIGASNFQFNADRDSQSTTLVNSMLDSELSKDSAEGSWKFIYEFKEISILEAINEK